MSPRPFETVSSEVDGVQVVAVRGELDLSTAPALEPALEEALGTTGSVMIDLSECEFIDSTGIALIVRARQQIDGERGDGSRRLVVCSRNEQVQRVLEISGLHLSIPVLGTRDEAMAALREGASGAPA